MEIANDADLRTRAPKQLPAFPREFWEWRESDLASQPGDLRPAFPGTAKRCGPPVEENATRRIKGRRLGVH